MREISELWIVNDSGLCLFHDSPELELDPFLFSGFITAINNISISKTTYEISDIEMKNHWLLFIRDTKTDLLFIARSKDLNNKKRIMSVLQQIHERFFKQFPPEMIEHWNGDLSVFKPFKQDLEGFFKDKIAKTKDMW
jgi:hypothetical protein